jgi:predicted small lipoprotein YifL
MLIIAMFLLSFSGCGYKADPSYTPNSDDVEFKVKDMKTDDKIDKTECNKEN